MSFTEKEKEIFNKGQWATRFSRPNTLYGWDCETLLVLNFNAIDLNSMEKYKE